MTGIKIYEHVHHEVKIEAAKSKRTVPNTASLLLAYAVELVRAGKLNLEDLDEANHKLEEASK